MVSARPRALALAALCAALLLTAAAAHAQRAPAAPDLPVPAPSPLELVPLPRELGPERPLRAPPVLTGAVLDPSRGLHFGIGFPTLRVESGALGTTLSGGDPLAQGALVHVEGVWGAWRAGYARQWYRADLPVDTTIAGEIAERVAFDSDQVWAFHGWRPSYSLYLGYGLGWQQRYVRVLSGYDNVAEEAGSSFLAGLMVDWAVGPPFMLQLRLFQDLSGGLVEVQGASLQLAYMLPF